MRACKCANSEMPRKSNFWFSTSRLVALMKDVDVLISRSLMVLSQVAGVSLCNTIGHVTLHALTHILVKESANSKQKRRLKSLAAEYLESLCGIPHPHPDVLASGGHQFRQVVRAAQDNHRIAADHLH